MTSEVLNVRIAEEKDMEWIDSLIYKLACYEKRPEDRTGSKEELHYWLFERKIATVQIAECCGEVVGYALYYPIFGSFAAVGKVHLEDFFIRQDMRGKGFGAQFLAKISADVLSEGYAGMEWSCLDWNKQAIGFYKKLGAKEDTGREYFEFDKKKLTAMAEQYQKTKVL